MIWQHVNHSIWYFVSCLATCCKILTWMAISLPDLTRFPRGSDEPVAEVPS